jgi:hypothetical protein
VVRASSVRTEQTTAAWALARLSAGVQGLQLVLEAGHQVLALELERRGEHGVLDRPGFQAQHHRPRHRVAREAGGPLGQPLEHRLVGQAAAQAGRVLPVQAQAEGQAAPFVLVQHHQRADEGLVLAHHAALGDQRVLAQGLFQVDRRDLLAGGGDDDVLDAAADVDAPVQDLGLVAGAQPAVGVSTRAVSSSRCQ